MKPKRPLWRRVLSALCVLVMLGAGISVYLHGLELINSALLALALISLATPVALDGGSVLEILVGFVEALVDGVVAIVDAIANAIAGIFSGLG